MKFLFIGTLFFLIPLSVHGQEEISANVSSPVIKNFQSGQENYHLITPVLMRESSTLNYQEEYAIRNGNIFQSFFSSLIIPGSGQIKNRSWWKAGLFFAIEATSVYLFVDNRNDARIGERDYEKYANRNWSVVQYSNWLVQYHEQNGLDNPHIDDLRQMLGNTEASFNVNKDWNEVNIDLLRQVERDTPYVTSDQNRTNNFSHTLPEYGSQQYYELISKYYQYQAGWKDYNNFHDNIGHTGTFYNERFVIDRGGSYASPFFYEAAQMAKQFNSDYRTSNTFLSILIANHVLSAFDAYFTFKMKQNRLEATSSIMPGKQIQLTYSF
ncbi:MAG: DUF5683 domain-containing protein [Balneolaceae bacterium]|nr:DUF5683 domain-containing protein [Balneolaceae bacterium]